MSTQLVPAPLTQLPLGVPGLDDVLGGGVPEHSCTVIAGGPGTGKTILAQQILFANTSAGRPGVYFTGPGEPPHKLLRHQQHLAFFEPNKVDRGVYIVDLGEHVVEGNSARVLDTIAREIEDRHASFVVIDLVRALAPAALWNDLAVYLNRCDATSFLIADCDPLDSPSNAILSSADTVLWLRQALDGDGTARTIQALKVRGQESLPGSHAVRLTWDGMQVFPRWPTQEPRVPWSATPERLSVGIEALDRLLGGGIPAGDAVLVEGPSGTGKSVLATQFIAENGRRGEAGVALLFEERPDRFVARAEALDLELERLIHGGLVEVLSFRGRDMAADELIHEVQRVVTRIRARCVVIDSLAGLELVLGTGGGLRDCLWRLLDALTGSGATVWLTSIPDAARPSLGSLVDDVLELRRLEQDGQVQHRLAVVKMRSSAHCADPLPYEIGAQGVELMQRDTDRSRNGHVRVVDGLVLSHSA